MNIFKMTEKDNYSFEPVGNVDPNASTPVVEAVPTSAAPESYYNEEAENENPSDVAIMVGCGVVGWMIA